MGEEKDESLSEKVGAMLEEAHRDVRDAASSVGPAISQAGDEMGRAAREAAGVIGPAVGNAAGKAGDLGYAALGRGYAELTRFGRAIVRTWDFVERQANPPWTAKKGVFWAVIFVLIVLITFLAYNLKYGILTLPIIAAAAGEAIAWLGALGPLGLFAFISVGTLFFMVIPTEPFFLLQLGEPSTIVLSIIAATLGSTLGALGNYYLGYRLRTSAGKGHGEERKMGRWGNRAHSKGGTVFLGVSSALPLPEIIGFGYGLADYPFKKFALVVLVGRAVKWTWIAGAFLLFQFSI